MQKRVCLVLMLLLVSFYHAKAENLVPEECKWEFLGRSPTVDLVATGPYYENTNIVVVIYIPYPERISKITFSNGIILEHPVLKEYELSLGKDNSVGDHVVTADVCDLAGRVQQVSAKFTVFSSNRYTRGLVSNNGFISKQDYLSSIIAIDEERGDYLDYTEDFSSVYGDQYPWFLRTTSEINAPCLHIVDPVLCPWNSPTATTCCTVNVLPILNNKIVGGAPPMMAFGSSAKNGTPLFTNQDYHFAVIAGRPTLSGALKIEVYEKSDFENNEANVAPVFVQTNNLPNTADLEQLETLRDQFYIQDYHLQTKIHGKVLDFDTKIQYQFGGIDMTWANSDFVTPIVVTHRSANDLFYYKVSFKGDAPSLDFRNGLCMAFQVDEQGKHEAYNLTYGLDFNQADSWSSLFIHEPSFQNARNPSPYLGKSVDELLHHTPMIQDTLTPPDAALWQRFTECNKTPELKAHPVLDQLVDDLNCDPLNIANYVQNNIDLTDAVGLSQTNDSISINPQGVMRDALGTYLERQGSPIEQCALLIYLLRRAGIPAGYIFPEHDTTFLFDQQLSAMLHMQLRGTANVLGQPAGIPELIPVNYPWVTAYINGKWVHLFPWIKDVEVKEGGDLWSYFPDNYKDARQWVCHYLQGDPNIRSLSEKDNIAVLFPLYAQKYLDEKNLILEDIGIRFRNRKSNQYQSWDDFPRPWQAPAVANRNLVDHLSDDFFDTISVQVFSDRNGNGEPDIGEPMLETGEMRFVDLHNRRLLLYHQIVPSTNPVSPEYQMTLSLEPYDNTPGSYDGKTTNSFFKNGKVDLESARAGQKISTTLYTAAVPDGLNDDVLCYKITCNHHKQALAASKAYLAQFPTLIENMDSIVDHRSLRKGDMAVLSLDYGRVTEEMKNFELKKYLDYQRALQEHPDMKVDPEMATGQLLQLMGMTYYFHLSEFQEKIEEWTKTHAISYRAHGLTELSPEHGAYGPVTNANKGYLDFNLCYPKVDMSFQRAVTLGNQTAHLESGANTEAGAQSLLLLSAEASAQEHHIINEFFNQADAISTVKLLDLTREQGDEILVLRPDNYQAEKVKSLMLYSAKNDIGNFVNLWNDIESFFQSNKNDPFATVFLTPHPVTATKQEGTPYVGMGAFSVSSTSSSAWITDRMSVANGGYGGSLEKPISSQQPEGGNNFIVPTPFGGFSFYQNPFGQNANFNNNNVVPEISLDHFQGANQQVAAGAQTLAPDLMGSLTMWNNTIHQAADDNGGPALQNTGVQTAALWKEEVNSGNLGTVSYYTSSAQAVREGVWKLVHDPVNVITGEFYINALDLELKGAMPLELRRVYGSQSTVNSNFGHGWKFGYFPYLVCSDDGNSTTPPSLIYAAEPDGSVIAYRYQTENKNWIPTIADNPEMVNNNDGTHLMSRNHFKNKIFKTAEDTYELRSCDGSVRTFVVNSFPLVGSTDIKRERPYLQRWSDLNGNYYDFHFGTNKNDNDYGELNFISSSNGSSLRFRYDPYGHIVEAFSSDGRHLKYSYDGFGDLVNVMLPDGSKISYQYQHLNENQDDKKTYSTHLITQVSKPQGRIIQNDYDTERRVVTQRATVGLSPKPVVVAQFAYDLALSDHDKTVSGKTTITDASKNQTTYEIAQSQITALHLPEGRNITQTWSAGNLTSRTDRRGLVTSFAYDEQGNLINQKVTGNLTGNNNATETATTQYSYNDKNFVTAVTDQLGNGTKYTYGDQAHPADPTCITKIADEKTISTRQLSYQDRGSVKGLLASCNSDGAITNYEYSERGFLSAMTRKSGTDDPDVVTQCTSNQRGEIVSALMSDGSQKKYSYDALGHPTGVEIFGADGSEIDWRFNYYNQNGELEWEEGARFNPVDQTYYDYDRAGNLLHQLSWLRAGIATTSYENDAQGNVISLTDPNHNVTTMSYDALGEMLSRTFADGSQEKFTYENGGKVATHQTVLGGNESYTYTSTGLLESVSHADGSSIQYRYDLSGRLVEEIFSNGLDCQISYQGNVVTRSFHDAQKNLGSMIETYDGRGNLVEKTDLAGNSWSYSYDGLNRLKSENGPPGSGSGAQQEMVYHYHPGLVSTLNAIGESSSHYFDALGRPTLTKIFNQDGSLAQSISNQYSGDHQSVTMTIGTGDHAIIKTTYTDEAGRPIMLQHADGSTQQWSYDLNGNLISFADEEGNKTSYVYDTLNHLSSEVRPDGSVINYSCNAAGEALTRSLPQGLIEQNNYNTAGEKISSSLTGADGAMTRCYSYEYDQGLLSSVSDPRGGKIAIVYDAWMHPIIVSANGSNIPEQNQTTTYSYDPRGLLASVEQHYNDPATGPSTLLSRDYDAYGQLASETTSLHGTNIAAWHQTWDGVGRRTALQWSLDSRGAGAQYQFSYNALGLMTQAQNSSGTCSYVYGDHGLLLSATTPAGQKNFQRDQQGRITQQTLSDGSQESLSWRNDGKLKSYSSLGNANETRNYDYDLLGRLAEEPYTLTCSADPNVLSVGTHTATYSFDPLGVRLKQEVTPEIKNSVVGKNSFSQVTRDDLNNDMNRTYPWTSSYDAAGAVTARGIEGEINQDLTWDSFGRLVGVLQRNNNNQGYNWKTTYDGLGRRIQTSYCDATGDNTTSQPLTVKYFYDPEVEFLELGRDFFNRSWNLYGPDRSGFYGGAQGIGGLETTIAEGDHDIHGVVNNFFGDSIGTTTGGVFQPWGNVLGGYGAMPGSSVNSDLVPQWRDHYLDWTGFYYMGARYYEPKSGRFLSPDPLGHNASLSLYDYCDGDPVNGLDPDGRCVEKWNQWEQQEISLNKVRYQNATLMNNMINTQKDIPTTLRGIGGELLSYFDGDLDDSSFLEARNQALQRVPNSKQVMSINGVFVDFDEAQERANLIASSLHLNYEGVLPINNYTHGLMRDILRAAVEQSGASDIRSMCLADIVNYNNGGKILGYSNGSVIMENAAPYINKSASANVEYTGLNPQFYIDQHKYGFKKIVNARNQWDVISLLFLSNWFRKWDQTIKTKNQWYEILKNHYFEYNYPALIQ